MRQIRVRELEHYALERLSEFFDPCPARPWKDDVLTHFSWMFAIDHDAREALRLFNRTRRKGVRVFTSRNLRVEFDLEVVGRLPPSARVLLLALINDEGFPMDTDRLLGRSQRASGSRDWLPPPLTSRGYVLSRFEACSRYSPPAEGTTLTWGERLDSARVRLTDTQLALLHAYLFPVESLEGGNVNDAPRTTVERERRTMKKARHHWLDDVTTPRAVRGVRFALPARQLHR